MACACEWHVHGDAVTLLVIHVGVCVRVCHICVPASKRCLVVLGGEVERALAALAGLRERGRDREEGGRSCARWQPWLGFVGRGLWTLGYQVPIGRVGREGKTERKEEGAGSAAEGNGGGGARAGTRCPQGEGRLSPSLSHYPRAISGGAESGMEVGLWTLGYQVLSGRG